MTLQEIYRSVDPHGWDGDRTNRLHGGPDYNPTQHEAAVLGLLKIWQVRDTWLKDMDPEPKRKLCKQHLADSREFERHGWRVWQRHGRAPSHGPEMSLCLERIAQDNAA